MTHIIAIAGPSCVGKTELARQVSRLLAAPILPMDAYYRDLACLPLDARCRFNFDVPDSLDHALFREQVAALAAGRTVQRPVYDFTVHARSNKTETIVPGAFLIIEGLFALYWEDVRQLVGTKVYVDAPDEVCLARRRVRDVRERGRTPESVLDQYAATVRPMAELYVHPTRRFADIVISGEAQLEQSASQVVARVRARRGAAEPASVPE